MDEREWQERMRRQRRREKAAVQAFIRAACAGDAAALASSLDEVELTGTWAKALRAIAKAPPIPSQLRQDFTRFVAALGDSLRSRVNDDLALIGGLRALLPSYEGPAVRLYRGDCFRARNRRTYGLSWSADRAVADGFAKGMRQYFDGGTVLVETLAPAAAIICAIHHFENRYEEDEYLVDRRLLTRVTVAARYP